MKKASVKKKTPARKPAAWPPSIGQIRAELVDALLEIAFDPQTPAGPRASAIGLLIEAADRVEQIELLAAVERGNRDLEARLKALEAKRPKATA